MVGIHLWNECWRRNDMDKNSSYPEGTIYQELRNRYLNIDDSVGNINNDNLDNDNLNNEKVDNEKVGNVKVDNENVGNVKVDNEKVGNVKVDNENTLNNNLKQAQSQNLINQPVIVYMVSYNTYLTKLSRVRFHGINKLQNHIKVIYYGNGWQITIIN